jgi:hypothetical protein
MSSDGHEQTEASREQEPTVERRAAIRRGAALLAGVTGLGVAAAAAAPSASAAPGDPVLQGASNDAAATTTSLTSSAPNGTLALSNTGDGAPLRVAASTTFPPDASTEGDYRSFKNINGFVLPTFTHVTGDSTNPAAWGFVYSDIWAFQPIPVVPQRALDTRTAAGRIRVLDPVGKFDSAGRLIAGKAITLALSQYAFGFGAVLGNLTVTGPLAGGYLTLYPADPRPGVSSINYVTGQTIANFSFTGLHFNGADFTVRIFAVSTTHVIFDVTGFAVGSSDFINPAILPSIAAQTSRINPATAPEWFRNQQARRARLGSGGISR